ncbi:DUF423 domain-containing protein [Reichenbachiella sp. MALMAid0571]|uniref:DUF423 domain-containing protein n=1 Tax=Reichenbachiella sp. MALMAid0571 TaxID=3143939 RepID=UPI0032DF9780
MNKSILIAGSVFGLLTVVVGAFGAHALHVTLLENGRIDTFETAVKYQGIHALALLIIGVLSEKVDSSKIIYAGYSMVIGVLIFSGSLYILSITNMTFLGAITPIGGLFMIAGWVLLILGILKTK